MARTTHTRRTSLVTLLSAVLLVAGLAAPPAARAEEDGVRLASVTLASGSVVGGASVTGTIMLARRPAPPSVEDLRLPPPSTGGAGGSRVQLPGNFSLGDADDQPAACRSVVLVSSHPSLASVPNAVCGPDGGQVSFTVTTVTPVAATAVTISATYRGATRSAPLLIVPPSLTTLTVHPSTLIGGAAAEGTVHLNGVVRGAVTVPVSLVSSHPAAVTVPATVWVTDGERDASFSIATRPVAAPVTVTLTASAGGQTRAMTLVVRPLPPVALAALTVAPWHLSTTPPETGTNVTGTLTLSGPAPAGGAPVVLTYASTATATVGTMYVCVHDGSHTAGTFCQYPYTLTVPAGASSLTFTVEVHACHDPAVAFCQGQLTATYQGTAKRATIQVDN